MTTQKKPLFEVTIALDCECNNELCKHQQQAMLKAVEDAWQSGRKAGIATAVEKIREASKRGLTLNLQNGELELPSTPSTDRDKTN
jgi:hypothetical protein